MSTSTRAADMARCLVEDIQSIRKRVERVVKGRVRMVDIGHQEGRHIVETLDALALAIPSAITPAEE